MSALAGPGDLAGSLGEMAEEQRHLLSVWDAGMLAATFLGLKAQLLPSTELLDSSCHPQPVSEASPAPICFPLAVSHLGGPWKRGIWKAAILSLESRLHPATNGGPAAPVLYVGWSWLCACDQDPRGSCWVNVTLWLKDCKQHQ